MGDSLNSCVDSNWPVNLFVCLFEGDLEKLTDSVEALMNGSPKRRTSSSALHEFLSCEGMCHMIFK